MKKSIASYIVLHGLELNVHLGWPEAERVHKQIVTIDIKIQFANPPHGCITDNLADTYCYDTLINAIKMKISEGQYRLLEHLSYKIYQIIKDTISNDILIEVHVRKKPAIAQLTGGVSFHYGDVI